MAGSHISTGTAVTGVVAVGVPAADVLGVSEAQCPPSAKAFLTGPAAVAERGVAGPADTTSQRGRGVVGDPVSMRGRFAGRSGCAPVGAVKEDEL